MDAHPTDEQHFRFVYKAYAPLVSKLCQRYCRDETLREDLVQMVFVRAWVKRNLYRGGAKYSTWLYRLGVNTVLNEMRRRKRATDRVFAMEASCASADDADVETWHQDSGDAIDIERALRTLSGRQRAVLEFIALQGLRQDEVAALLGITRGTVAAHLYHARQRMRELLPDYRPGPTSRANAGSGRAAQADAS